MPLLSAAANVAIFALGDSRHHANTFCGGIQHLFHACARNQIKLVGAIRNDRYIVDPPLGPSLPGLVLDYKKDMRKSRAIIAEWLATLELLKVTQSAAA